MPCGRGRGWHREPTRHALAARGIPTIPPKDGTRRPGKFEGCPNQDVGETLHSIVGQGFTNEEIGDVNELGWYGLILDAGEDIPELADSPHVIVNEDSNGFFTYEAFPSESYAMDRWATIQKEYKNFYSEDYPEKEDTPSIDLPMERYTERESKGPTTYSYREYPGARLWTETVDDDEDEEE